MNHKLVPHHSHWGAFNASWRHGKLVGAVPFDFDPDPSPLIEAIPDSVHSPLRIARPMIRAGWLKASGLKEGQTEDLETGFLPRSRRSLRSASDDRSTGDPKKRRCPDGDRGFEPRLLQQPVTYRFCRTAASRISRAPRWRPNNSSTSSRGRVPQLSRPIRIHHNARCEPRRRAAASPFSYQRPDARRFREARSAPGDERQTAAHRLLLTRLDGECGQKSIV